MKLAEEIGFEVNGQILTPRLEFKRNQFDEKVWMIVRQGSFKLLAKTAETNASVIERHIRNRSC